MSAMSPTPEQLNNATGAAPPQYPPPHRPLKVQDEPAFCKHCCAKVQVHHQVYRICGKDRMTVLCVAHNHYIKSWDARPKTPAGDSSAPSAPRTGTLTDGDMMPFGSKYGPKSDDPRKLGDVPGGYLLWIGEQPWVKDWPALAAYIETNRARLEKESDK